MSKKTITAVVSALIIAALAIACGNVPTTQPTQKQPTSTPNLQQVYATAQTRGNELQTEVSK